MNQSGTSRKATRAQIISGLASGVHEHSLASITDSGALAALDSITVAQIDPAAYASQAEATAGTDFVKIMTPARTAQAIGATTPAAHQHTLADVTDTGALAGLDRVGTAEIEAAAYASQGEALAGTENSKIMTALRTAEAIVALSPAHQHLLSDISDAGALAALDLVGSGEIGPNAVTSGKILIGAVTSTKLGSQAVVESKLASSAVTETKIASAAVTEAKIASGAVTEAKIADGAVGASKLQSGIPIDMQDALLRAPEIRDYSETSPTASISSGTLTLDLESGNAFEVTLTQDVTALILANPPAAGRAGSCSLIVKQDATGGRSFAWNESIKWAGGEPPAITSAENAIDVYSLVTRDGGVTWYGFPGGQDFS
jgi:hypothetical protein